MAETARVPAPHPYYPESILLSGSIFIPNSLDAVGLVTAFGAGCAVILGSTLLLVKRLNPSLKFTDKALILWFVLCGTIHLFFEGYFMYNHSRMGSRMDLFGQLWKEYALSDSRYMHSDPFVLCMETFTAITWGPLSFLTAVLITKDSPYRHAIQALVSTGQFYGDLLYYMTSLFDDYFSGRRFYRPEPYYFWFYFVFMNAFWIIIPLLCLYSSIKASARAFSVSSKLAVQGSVKKTL
ncbi:3-beta-hydroxysteroid-Delta(8),Delta(7)-isomerase [Lachnellula occidentalis]|uniref:3-beta-hydroxysteroid-Delta(8), Delta(7)-isomerase n=1 Tax=Lachnellula occidentalis TaxID=215460 RepID=A0A8H8UK16_9HELO|nr:3-beta-hydroxysteroid-Delta(8),Delta(7)-isomerase [Lachnellula occidentalis]